MEKSYAERDKIIREKLYILQLSWQDLCKLVGDLKEAIDTGDRWLRSHNQKSFDRTNHKLDVATSYLVTVNQRIRGALDAKRELEKAASRKEATRVEEMSKQVDSITDKLNTLLAQQK